MKLNKADLLHIVRSLRQDANIYPGTGVGLVVADAIEKYINGNPNPGFIQEIINFDNSRMELEKIMISHESNFNFYERSQIPKEELDREIKDKMYKELLKGIINNGCIIEDDEENRKTMTIYAYKKKE